MGQAKNRGTFWERKQAAIERQKQEREEAVAAAALKEANMTPEELTRRYNAQRKQAAFATWTMPWMD